MTVAQAAIRPGRRLGCFTVDSVLGTGGLATVYLAHGRRIGSRAALKVINDDGRTSVAERRGRLGHEAMMLDVVRAADVPRVLELGTSGGTPWLAMSAEGTHSLSDDLREHGAYRPREAREVVLRIAMGLQRVHDAGVLHMDLTPSNVMLDHRRAVLIDFGAARVLGGSPLAGSGSYDGTAGYVAPERGLGAAPSPAMDVFSLGAVTYRVLLGVRPYVDSRTLETSRCISPKRLRPPHLLCHDITPALSSLLLQSLSLDPDQRPPSPAAFATAFAAAVGDPL